MREVAQRLSVRSWHGSPHHAAGIRIVRTMLFVRMNLFAPLLVGALLLTGPSVLPPLPPEKIARELVANFNVSRFQAAVKDFNSELSGTVTTAILATQRKEVEAHAGRFMTVTSARSFRHDGFPVIDLVCRYERASIAFRVVFDHLGKISTVFIDPVQQNAIDPLLEAPARAFLDDFNARRFDALTKRLDASMQKELTQSRLKQMSDAIAVDAGAWQSVKSLKQTTNDGLRVITILNAYEKGPVEFRLVYGDSGSIAGLRIGRPAPAQ